MHHSDVSLTAFNLDTTRLASWEDTLRNLSRERSALRGRVEELLARLHPIERDIIELYYFQGVRQKGISQVIGSTQQAVSHRLRSASRRLIFLLEQPEIPLKQMARDLAPLLAHIPRAVEVLCDYAHTSSQLETGRRVGLSQQRVSDVFTQAMLALGRSASLDAIVYLDYFTRLTQHKNVYVYQDQRPAVRRRKRRAPTSRGGRQAHARRTAKPAQKRQGRAR